MIQILVKLSAIAKLNDKFAAVSRYLNIMELLSTLNKTKSAGKIFRSIFLPKIFCLPSVEEIFVIQNQLKKYKSVSDATK